MGDIHVISLATPDSRCRISARNRTMEIKSKSQASIALEQATLYLERAQHILSSMLRGATDKLPDARRTRLSDLRKLLANSLDANVVTDADRRLVYANPKALDLFGISESNMRKFTLDTFISHCQILELRRKWFAIRRDERYGKCKVTRLDGSLRIAEYILVANIVPRLCLYRFLNAVPPGITPLGFSAKMIIGHTGPALGNQFSNSQERRLQESASASRIASSTVQTVKTYSSS
jgi:PAS domain S-box-containing protein